MAVPSAYARELPQPRAAAGAAPARLSRTARRWVALIAIMTASFVILGTWIWRNGSHPNGAWAPGSSDHYSHWSSTILFRHRGLDIYRLPAADVCPPAPAYGVYALVAKGDTCNIPERVGMRPLVTNWRQFPRPYPPGWLLYHAPIALLHEATTLEFETLNRLIIIQYLFFAHLLIGALAAALLFPRRGERAPDHAAAALRTFVVAVAASEIVRWTMLGYYDGVAVLCSVLGVVALGRRRDVDALFWLSAGVFLHFRALWLLPLLGFAGLRALRSGELREHRAKVVAAGAMLAAAAVAFLLVRPALAGFPRTNPIFHALFDRHMPERWDFFLPLAVASFVLLRARAALLFVALAFQLFVVWRTPQIQPWHALSMLPLLVLARFERHRAAEVAAFAVFLVECRQVFDVAPLPGIWAAALFSS